MGFQDAVKTCLRKYVTFSGRASRSEYWWFALFLFLGSIVASTIDGALFGATVETGPGEVEVQTNGPLASLFSLAMLLPSLAAGWRRMHDSGRSGFYLLYPIIVLIGISIFVGVLGGFDPLLSGNVQQLMESVGAVIVIVAMLVFLISPLLVIWWLTRPSQPGNNEWGPNPHEVSA